VASELQPRVGVGLQGEQAQLVEPFDLGLCKVAKADLRQRRAAPQRQPGGELLIGCDDVTGIQRAAAGIDRALKDAGVKQTVIQRQPIAPVHRLHGESLVLREDLAQARDRHLQTLTRARRPSIPQPVNETISRNRVIGVDHQARQQRDLPRSTKRDTLAVDPDFHRAEDPHAEVDRPHGDTVSAPRARTPSCPMPKPMQKTIFVARYLRDRDLQREIEGA